MNPDSLPHLRSDLLANYRAARVTALASPAWHPERSSRLSAALDAMVDVAAFNAEFPDQRIEAA